MVYCPHMDNQSIEQYVADERARGVLDPDIRAALLSTGWKEEVVDQALSGNAAPLGALPSRYQIFSGRLGRWHYLMSGLLLGALFIPVLIAFFGGIFWSLMANDDMSWFAVIGVVMVAVFFIIVSTGLAVRRLHDLGHTGWWVLLSFIPYVSMGIAIYLLFFRGMKTVNQYGPVDTTPRTFSGVWSAIWKK